jgi:large subunit ribosomal protein L9
MANMQVILLERVPKLGQMGEVVNVKPGFARNYLIPQRKALRATKRTLEDFERRRVQLEANNLQAKEEAQKLAGKVDGQSVTILRQAGEAGILYGSVNARDVAQAFTEAGITLDRRQILLDEPIKTLGIHRVTVALHPEVEVTVTVNVARTQEEADIQAGKLQPTAEGEGEDEASEEERSLIGEIEALVGFG